MSLLKGLTNVIKSVSDATKAYTEGSINKKKSTGTSKTANTSYTPLGSNSDDYIKNSNASDFAKIQAAKSAYETAKAAGDINGMKNANDAANAVRAEYGYSGGSDGSQYIGLGTTKTNPYEEAMSTIQDKYDTLAKQQKEANDLAIKQGINRLENQKSSINQSYDDNARQAYITSMQSKKNLPQQLAANGVSGGATETANLNLSTNYENNLTSINQNRTNALNDIDTAITELKNNGDLSTVEQALNNSQQALSAYQNLIDSKINYDTTSEENNIQKQLDTINQYSNDYMAEINRRSAINPNDPLIPYLYSARQDKINNQKTAEVENESAAIKQQQEIVWKLFQETGKADSFIEAVLGIPKGTTTLDYANTQYDINKPYYKPISDGDEMENVVDYATHKSIIENNFTQKEKNPNGDVDGEYYTITYDKQKIKDYLESQNIAGRLSDSDAMSLLSYYRIHY